MRAKPGLGVVKKWMIVRSGSAITEVTPFHRQMPRFDFKKNYIYSVAPFVGAAFTACVGYRLHGIYAAGYFSIGGFVAGCVLWILYHPLNATAGPERVSPSNIFWTIVALLLCWVPVIGLIFALVAFGMNSSCKHWIRTCSNVILAISILSLVAMFAWIIVYAKT